MVRLLTLESSRQVFKFRGFFAGSLASYTGFAVDKECALTTIVDGEIVVRRDSSKLLGVVSALLSFDKYLNVDPDFKMYNVYDSTKDVLFQVSNKKFD
jgi:hypothetical protein